MADFCLPSLGADMEVATLMAWKVGIGDHVHRGDIVAEVETTKGTIEIEIFEDGIVEEIKVKRGEEVPVGTVLAVIRSATKNARDKESESHSIAKLPASSEEDKLVETGLKSQPHLEKFSKPELRKENREDRIKAVPSARKLAREKGIALENIHGTGKGGIIHKVDVLNAIKMLTASKAAPKERIDKRSPENMRQAIAAAMSRSNTEIPHYYLQTRIDMSNALSWLQSANSVRTVTDRLLLAALLVKSVALALKAVPELNGYWKDNKLQRVREINIGLAIALREGGLVLPAIHHVDEMDLDELMKSMNDTINRARSNRLRSSELTEGTITVSNLGDLGVETMYGVIYPPQVAIVCFGKIYDHPWVENGMVAVRQVVNATLAGDHRATDGKSGARFLGKVNYYLQHVEGLNEE